MIIFPAIDIKDNKCVRLVKGDFDKMTSYENSPFDQAKIYFQSGFKNIHIVDLDGALKGKSSNSNIVKEIIKNLDIKIQIGGGIRTIDEVENWVKSGVDKVIIGTAAIENKNFLKTVCEKFENKIAISLDVKDKSHMYFIHSYEFMTKHKDCIVATTNYGNSIIVSVAKENIVGTQFHPEKSQKNGLIILENFLKWKL